MNPWAVMVMVGVGASAGAGATAAAEIVWQPVFAMPAVVAILAAVGYLSVRATRVGRSGPGNTVAMAGAVRAGLIAARVVAVMAAAVVLLNPCRVEHHATQDSADRRPLLVMVDHSRSMCTADAAIDGAAASRLAFLQHVWLSDETMARLSEQHDPVVWSFGEALARIPAREAAAGAPEGDETRLADQATAVLRSAEARQAEGLVILSDGHDTTPADVGAVAVIAADLGIPVFTVTVGGEASARDVAVRLAADHGVVHRGQSTVLRGEIDQHGFEGRSAEAVLSENGREIARRQVRLGDEPARLVFGVTPRAMKDDAGQMLVEYRLSLEAIEGEANRANNVRHAFVHVEDDRIRVALFENEPAWDTRFLAASLRGDSQIELTTVIGTGRKVAVTRNVSEESSEAGREGPEDPPTFDGVSTVTTEWLDGFDVVILGHGVERWFGGSSVEVLRHFVVERGGAVVMARGNPFDVNTAEGSAAAAMEELSPVRWAEGRAPGGRLARTTDATARSILDLSFLGDTDVILTELPGMLAQTRIDGEKSVSTIWLRTTDPEPERGAGESSAAAVAHVRVGSGIVFAVLTDGLWRWAFLPPGSANLDPVYHLFWRRAVRWLAGAGELLPGQSVGMTVSPLAVAPGRAVEILVVTRYVERDAFHPRLVVVDPAREAHDVALVPEDGPTARYRARFVPQVEGVHEVRLECPGMQPAALTCRFAAYDPGREMIDPSAEPEVMAEIAATSGGKVIRPAHPEDLLEALRRHREASVAADRVVPAWDRAWLLSLIIACLAGEWFVRRRVGLS